MNEKDFIEKLVILMDTESDINMESLLEEIEEWDSLSFVSFLAMASTASGEKIHPGQVLDAVTVRDLYNIALGEK